MRRLPILLFLLVLIGTGLLSWLRADESTAAVGPSVALCPGPDLYGYTCADATAFAYIDASEDTGLQIDDGAVQLPLPFPFTFYGTTYEALWASSNGTLQFGTRNPLFNNSCLEEGPAANMGDMIAPYWDDLDLTMSGALKVGTVGEAPDRIFVVEWDEVPPFRNPDESVTFAVQLYEGSNDIVFLYPEASTSAGARGSGATVGLQSEAQGLALQYSCNQAVIADGSGLHYRHPAAANETLGLEVSPVTPATGPPTSPVLKGPASLLRERFGSRGVSALPALRRHWLGKSDPLLFTWEWTDLDSDGTPELIGLWHGPTADSEVAQIAVFHATVPRTNDTFPELEARYVSALSTREVAFARPELIAVRDLTNDALLDIVIADEEAGRVAVIALTERGTSLHHLPQACRGPVALSDTDGDSIVELRRGDCGPLSAKKVYTWQSGRFATHSP